jgi:adenylate kinase
MKRAKKFILIFLGPPGSGKGTQAEMISKKIKLPTISTGELLREEIRAKTKIGRTVEKIIAKGKYAPEEIIEKIISKRIKKADAKRGFILDGFPRNKKQLNYLIEMLKIKRNLKRNRIPHRVSDFFVISNRASDPFVIAILVDVSDKEVKSRLGGRRVCACGATYHIKFNPPKKKGVCDLCGSKLRIRDDDKPSVIANRLKIYHKEIAPIINYWEKNGKLIKINGEQSIKKVQKNILNSLNSKFKITNRK